MDEPVEPPPPPPPSPAAEDETIYEVEEILKSRRRNGQYQYYLRWKNFDESHNTWEPEENLYSPELLEEFWSKAGGKKPIGTSKPKARKPKKETPKVKDEPEDCESMLAETSKKLRGRKKRVKEDEDADSDWEQAKVTTKRTKGTKRKIKDDDLSTEAPVAKKTRSKKTSAVVETEVHDVSAQFVMVGTAGTPGKSTDPVLWPFRETTNDEPSLDLSINSTFSAEPQASSTLHAKDIQCTPSYVLLPLAKENLPVTKLFNDQHNEASISQAHNENSNAVKSSGKSKVVEFRHKKKSPRSSKKGKTKTNTENSSNETQQSSSTSGTVNFEPAPYSAAIMEVSNLPIFKPSKSKNSILLASNSMLTPRSRRTKAPLSEVAIQALDAVVDTEAKSNAIIPHENKTAVASCAVDTGRLRKRKASQVCGTLLSEVFPGTPKAEPVCYLPVTLNCPQASSSMVQPEHQSRGSKACGSLVQSESRNERVSEACSSVTLPERQSKRISELANRPPVPVAIEAPKRLEPKGNPDFFRMMMQRLDYIAKDTGDVEAWSFEGEQEEHPPLLDPESALQLSLVEEDMVDLFLEELESSVPPPTPPGQNVLSEEEAMPKLSTADKQAVPGFIAQNPLRKKVEWIDHTLPHVSRNHPPQSGWYSEELHPQIVECWGGADMSAPPADQQLRVTATPLQHQKNAWSNNKTPEMITIDDTSSTSSSSIVDVCDMNYQQPSAVNPDWMLHDVFPWSNLSCP